MANYYYPPFDNQDGEEINRRNFYYQTKAKQEKKEIRKLGNILGGSLFMFIACQYIAVFVLQAFGLSSKMNTSVVFQNSFLILGVELFSVVLPFGIMAITNKKKYNTDIIPTKKIKAKNLFLWVGFGMFFCIIANYFVNVMIALFRVFGYQLKQAEVLKPDSIFACVVVVLGTAVVPAICEEFAMRCCSLGLLRKYGKAFGVFAVSIIFGLLHGNVIQFVFAGLVGIVLGYVTIKTGSVVPAIIIHGLNNGMSAFSSVMEYALGQKAGENATVVLFIFWIIVGLVCLIMLASKKQLKREEKRIREPFENSLGTKLATFFFVPGMIVPFVYLIYATITTIEKM